jgi:hypothetical protein
MKLVGTINHVDVSKYLHDLGWSEISTKRNYVKIFQLNYNNEFFQIDLPISRDLRDYNVAMYRTVETIATANNKNMEQIILELLNPMSDVLKFRINEPEIENGSIFVEDAIKLYENVKKLITATAMDVLQPKKIHLGRPDSNTTTFINSCRFGQTEIGSYVVSVACPIANIINNKYEQLTLFDDEDKGAYSLTRKIINRLISSVNVVKESIDKGNLESAIYNNSNSEYVVSANFLDALSEINIYRNKSVLNISAQYAPTIRKNMLDSTSVTVNSDYYKPINALVRKIKIGQENEKTYVGRISRLNAIPDAEKRVGGLITIIFIDESGKRATASVNLKKEDYDSAIEAHREGKNVQIIGILSGSQTKKIEYTSFGILEL